MGYTKGGKGGIYALARFFGGYGREWPYKAAKKGKAFYFRLLVRSWTFFMGLTLCTLIIKLFLFLSTSFS